VLQRRPNTFSQTNLLRHFFACDKAADHTFRFARCSGTRFLYSPSLVPAVRAIRGRNYRAWNNLLL